MVEHEVLFGEELDQLDRRGELPRVDQHVIDEAASRESRNSALEVPRQYEAIVRFILDDVSDAHQSAFVRESIQLIVNVRGA